MPSLFSKFRHRKSSSTSSTPSAPASPTGRPPQSPSSQPIPPSAQFSSQSSPSQPQTRPADSQSPTTAARNAPATPTRSTQRYSTGGGSGARSGQGGMSPIPASSTVGRSARRSSTDLPNASRGSLDLTRQISGSSPRHGSTAQQSIPPVPALPPGARAGTSQPPAPHAPPFADEKDRPALPTTESNVLNPPPDPRALEWKPAPAATLPSSHAEFDLVAVREAPTPMDEDGGMGSGISHARRTASPPLPHVDEVDRRALHEAAEHRPKPVVASSAKAAGEGGPEFPHISALYDQAAAEVHPAGENLDTNLNGVTNDTSTSSPRFKLRSSTTPHDTASNYITPHLAALSFDSSSRGPKQSILDLDKSGLSGQFTNRAIESERGNMVENIARNVGEREEGRAEINGEARQAFEKAGLGDKVGMRGTVDVRTKWMEPVVQEHIIRKEHTEITEIIDRHIHKHDIYPKIQPIHDPDPIVLPTRHRIFSAADGKWHEVVGDAAAIAILGEDVFHRGKKENREVRNVVLPGEEEAAMQAANGTLPVGGRTKDEERMLHEGYGGVGVGRVMEREYKLGEEANDWSEINQGGGWLSKEREGNVGFAI